MTKTRKILYVGVFVLIAALLVLGVFFDTKIADRMYQPENTAAIILEIVGIFPPFIFVASMFVVLFLLVKREDKNRVLKKVLCTVGAAFVYVGFGFTAVEQVLDGFLWRVLVGLGTAVILTPLTFLVFRKRSQDTLKRLAIFLIFASIVAVISSLISINVLKYLWGRPRYREMMADGDFALTAFTPWYKINGFSLHGHHSFPSGHTCSATNLLVLCALGEVFSDEERKSKAYALFCAVYIFAMAYSRMVLGAHFLSDVTGGFFIGFLTYVVARYVYFDKSRIVVEAIMETNRPKEDDLTTEAPVTEEPRVEVDVTPVQTEEEILFTKQVVDAEDGEEPPFEEK